MKIYYLHNGKESSGPFDLEDLKLKKLERNTPIWCDGMANWTTAGEVAEIKRVFDAVPPPLESFPKNSTILNGKSKKKNRKIVGLARNKFYLVAAMTVLVIGLLIANHLQKDRKTSIEQINSLTEKNNHQYQLQQKEIQEQKQRIAEQEALELERLTKERKESINNRLSEVNNSIYSNNAKLKEAKLKLSDANDFHFLRSAGEREEEITAIQNDINYLKNENEKLEQEKNLLYLQLEKIR